MDAELRRQLLQTMADRFPSAVLAVGPGDEVLLCNAAAGGLLGLAGKVPCRLEDFPADTAAALAAVVARARAAVGELRGEELTPEATAPRRVLVDALPLQCDGARGVLLLMRDQHEQVAACSELLGEVSHELRTPLTSMQSTLHLVLGEEAGPINDDQRRFLTMSARAAERMGRLVDGLLDTAQQHTGRLSLTRRDVEVSPLLLPLLEQMRILAGNSQRALEWDIDPHAQAHAHADRWLEMVDNLVGNALKYTPRGGHIRVSLRGDVALADAGLRQLGALVDIDVRGALLTVEDDGPGLAATRRRGEATEGAPAGFAGSLRSSGLGLSITQALVRAHDGRLEFEGRSGVGTSVRVWIPATEPVARLLATAAQLNAALLGGAAHRKGAHPRGQVLVAELPAGRSALATRELEARLRQGCPGANWVGALSASVGVAAVGCPPRAEGPRGRKRRLGLPEAVAWSEPSPVPGGTGLGWAAAPADGVDVGTLLAVALNRARVPLAAAARGSHRQVPKEECRG